MALRDFQVRASGVAVFDRPESRLIIACCRTVLDPDGTERVRGLLRQDLDWKYLISQAEQNFVGPLVYSNLINFFQDEIPEDTLRNLKARLYSYTAHTLNLTAELIRIISLFSAHGVKGLSFKGPTLAASAYGDLSLRLFSDLDILVPRREFQTAAKLLASIGYVNDAFDGVAVTELKPRRGKKDYRLVSRDGRVKVELHWRLSGMHFDLPLDLGQVWSQLDSVTLAGVEIQTLPKEELFLYLCMHGARHGWERLLWICDVAELLRRGGIDWEVVQQQSTFLGCEKVLLLGLAVAQKVLGAEAPVAIPSEPGEKNEIEHLVSAVSQRLFRETGESMDISQWYTYHLGMKERKRDRLKVRYHYYLRYFRLALKPNERDRKLLLLPSSLSAFYYLVRPVRLVNDHAIHPLRRLFRRAG